MDSHHIIYKLYIWLYDKNGRVLNECFFEASTVYMLFSKILAKIRDKDFINNCERAENFNLTLLENKEEVNYPVYSEIFRQRTHEFNLTPCEKEVMYYKSKGLTDLEAAGQLFISPGTVNAHLKNIFVKLQVHNITEAIYKLSN